MSHSPEQWRIDPGNDLRDANGKPLELQEGQDGGHYYGLSADDMRRVVACINFCRGTATEQLEGWNACGETDLESRAGSLLADRGYSIYDKDGKLCWGPDEPSASEGKP